MTTENSRRQESILKSLAIAGLFGITIFIAWLAIQIVQLFPAALASLVSVANSVYTYNPLQERELTVTPSATTVTSGTSFTVSWDRPHASGTYVFSFACTDGLKLNLSAAGKDFSDLRCSEQYDLGIVDTITLTPTTPENQVTDLSYTVAFYRPNGHSALMSTAATTTVMNTPLATTETASSTEQTPVAVAPTPEPIVPTTKPTPTPTPTSIAPAPATPKPTTNFTYAIPTSDPTGTTDLVVTYLGVGTLTSRNDFVKTDRLEAGDTGALQFAVHNIGSRTSERWTYRVELPDGSTYTSDAEVALKPNERSVITLGFPALPTTLRTATINITVSTERDANRATNTVSRTITVLR